MALTKVEVEKLSNLARLKLSEAEKEKFAEQITSIFEYVKQIEEVDTSKVRETDHHGVLKNVFRADEVRGYQDVQRIIRQFPEKYGNLNKVKKVFE